MLKLRYLSHSAFLLDDGEHQLIIDPFITGNPTSPVKTDEINAKYIALTHGHGDHLGDAVQLAKNNNALVIAVNELANYVSSQDASAHNMHIGGAHQFPFGKLKFTIAHHGSSNDDGTYMGEPAGIVVNMGGTTIYHTGDTGLFLDMQLIGTLNQIDVLLVPIGDNFTMGINDALKAVEFVNPGITIPMHYNTFPVIEADPHDFKTKVEASGKKCRVMQYGETMRL